MNLLYRKSRLDWRQRDQEGSKKSFSPTSFPNCSSNQNDSSATVGKVRDLASFRRHFRMGFMTMPASQDLSPHSCASAMAPRSQSCHAVGAGDTSLENGDYPDAQSQHCGRCPPTKPKRHPSTRLSSSDGRGLLDMPPLLASSHSQTKHSEKKNAMKKSDSGEIGGKKVPPLKPKRSPSTQLTFESLPPRVPHSATPLPFQAADSQIQKRDGEDEPVYIEMVGQVFTRESQTATPHPVTPVATTPDSDSDQSEAIYEEMKYPQSKATVSISHSSPLPSSASSTPVLQVLSTSPHTPRAPTPYLLQGTKSESESNTKIPAPFPNLLQHRPPLLAFPQPAAASSGVGVQNNVPSSLSGSKESGGSSSQQDKNSRDAQWGPAPGLRARSHSTPLPPSSKSTSPLERGLSRSPQEQFSEPGYRPDPNLKYRSPTKERGIPYSLQLDHTPSTSKSSTSSTPTPLSSSQRPHSRPHLRSHTPHGLPAYKPPSSDSPLLWTYPSGGFRRPPAYESLRGSSQTPSLQQPSSLTGVGEGSIKSNGGSSSLHSKVGFMPWDDCASLAADEGSYWPMQRKLSFSHGSRETETLHVSEDEGRAWNGSADALLRVDKEDLGMGSRGGHSGIPVHFSSATSRALGLSESVAGVDSSPGFRALPRVGLPLPCQTFPACRNGGEYSEVGRLGRSSSAAGVRQVGGGDVQRQSSLPVREALNQPAVAVPAARPAGAATQSQRDGKLLEVIERKRCLCKEIKAHRRPDKSLCKQDSMPILPSWRRTPEPRKTGTPPCQRPQAVVWDTAI
uniref:Neuronal tyrosine phosphorylated phosphoinositide-3-kinase adaptor 1 n=1 Tax=Gasterosteus aculeatus TaxID=69293 RepID=G3QAN5_GASAC